MKRVRYGMTAMCFLYEESLDKMEDMSVVIPSEQRAKSKAQIQKLIRKRSPPRGRETRRVTLLRARNDGDDDAFDDECFLMRDDCVQNVITQREFTTI